MRRGFCGAAAAIAMVLACAPSATAATQIGATFPPVSNCNLATWLYSGQPSGPHTVPFSGVITSWSFQAASPAPDLNFKVTRPTSGNNQLIVAESGVKDTVPNALNTFPARIPAQAGDLIGYYTATAGNCRSFPAGYTIGFYAGIDDPTVGSEKSFSPLTNQRLDLSATLEADADCDGFGDETQDPAIDPAGCSPPSEPQKLSRSLTLDANKNKVKRGKKVMLSGRLTTTARQGPCGASQTVELQRKRPKQPAFATFAEVQSDAQGGFSLKQKLKKTFEFRAQVLETAACTAALSDSERVRVKKRR